MRKALGYALDLLERDLYAAVMGEEPVLTTMGPQGPIKMTATRDEILRVASMLAKYSVGRDDTKTVESTKTIRYVVRLPAKTAYPPGQNDSRTDRQIDRQNGTPLALPPGDSGPVVIVTPDQIRTLPAAILGDQAPTERASKQP
jgi:hypothetical protein